MFETLKMRLASRLARSAIKAQMGDVSSPAAFEASLMRLLGGRTTAPRLGGEGLLNAYNTMPWLRAVVGKVSWTFASLRWKLYVAQDPKTGKAVRDRALQRAYHPLERTRLIQRGLEQGSLREIEGSHPLLEMLERGNPEMPGILVRQLGQTHLDLMGECAWIIDKDAMGVPFQLWAVPPTWIRERPRPGRDTYLIWSPTGQLEVPRENLMFWYHPNPADPYTRGTGTAHALGDDLETDAHAASFIKSWFMGRALPPVLIAGENMRKDELDRLEGAWLAKLSTGKPGGAAVSQTNVPFFVNRKMDVTNLSTSFNDMQLVQLREAERNMIVNVYGMPPEIFGILESSNRATIEAAEYLYGKYVVGPRAEFARAMIQWRLVPLFDERLVTDYELPSLEDKEYALKVMTAQPAAFNLDDWRKRAGVENMEDETAGSLHFVPANVVPTPAEDLSTVGKERREAANPPAPGEDPFAEGGEPGDEEDEDAVPPKKKPPTKARTYILR